MLGELYEYGVHSAAPLHYIQFVKNINTNTTVCIVIFRIFIGYIQILASAHGDTACVHGRPLSEIER